MRVTRELGVNTSQTIHYSGFFCYLQLNSHIHLDIQMIHQLPRTKRGTIVLGQKFVILAIVSPSYSLRESA